jgi:hypothetical protein
MHSKIDLSRVVYDIMLASDEPKSTMISAFVGMGDEVKESVVASARWLGAEFLDFCSSDLEWYLADTSLPVIGKSLVEDVLGDSTMFVRYAQLAAQHVFGFEYN